MEKDEWPKYEDSFEDRFDNAAIVDSPKRLSRKIDWIYEIAEKPEIGKKPGFWEHYYSEVFFDAEFIRGSNIKKKYLHPPNSNNQPVPLYMTANT